jgi:methyl-accepting chemotaxis protein
MILRGESKDIILQYMKEIYVELLGKQSGFKTDSIYGYFDVFEGAFLHSKGWSGGAGYNPAERPWYEAAVSAGDKLAATPIYWNLQLNDYCITFVRRLFNETGQPLGVVCLNVLVGDIIKSVTEMKLTKNSYGVLHDEYFNIYYHPDSSIIGENGRDVGGGVAALEGAILEGKTFSEYETTNFSGVLTIAFSSRLKNGWFLFFIIPKAEYYQGTWDMALILGVFGLFLAAGLIIIFICVDKVKQKLP